MGKPQVVLIVDGPDPDNFAAMLVALSRATCFTLVAVIMTGRPVSSDHQLPPHAYMAHASIRVQRDNALHAKGILMRHGGEHVAVFQGGQATYSGVPHRMHIHERVTDVYDDMHAAHSLDGDLRHAVPFLAGLEGPLHFICGGPLTDLAYLIDQPMLHGKLGIATAQLGMFGTNPEVKTFIGGNKQFNVSADPAAAHRVLFEYPGAFYMVPTDVTKDPSIALHGPDDAAALSDSSANKELAAMYRRAWPHMWAKMGPNGSPAHLHDVHPVELMDELLCLEPPHHSSFTPHGGDAVGRYTVSPAAIGYVPHQAHDVEKWGEIRLIDNPAESTIAWPRFLAAGCDYRLQRQIFGSYLDAVNTPLPLPAEVP